MPDIKAETELKGSKVNYYLVKVQHPQREEQPPYQAECEDIIRALNMTFDEGCEFKAIWRTASGRLGNGKPNSSARYDAEKRVHYANASLREAIQQEQADETGWLNWGMPGQAQPAGYLVEIILSDGTKNIGACNEFNWETSGSPDDIVKYRILPNQVVDTVYAWRGWDGVGIPNLGINDVVQARYRSGRLGEGSVNEFEWSHSSDCKAGGDIIEYRIVRFQQ